MRATASWLATQWSECATPKRLLFLEGVLGWGFRRGGDDELMRIGATVDVRRGVSSVEGDENNESGQHQDECLHQAFLAFVSG
jgi:hypothetical protein